MRKLASIQKVLEVNPIPEADSIEQLKVLGWSLVAKKGEFKPGDLCVFFEIDSLLPSENPVFAFMEKAKFRVKTIRLRGVLSQGLALPLSTFSLQIFNLAIFNLNPYAYFVSEGEDVTEELGITKWEPPIDATIAGDAKCQWPFSTLAKTDETRIQTSPTKILEAFKDKTVYVTTKMDGSSGTFGYVDGVFHVCSRNLSIKESDTNAFWMVARKYNLENILRGTDIIIQGEVYGEGIQKNRIGIKGIDLAVFNVYNSVTQQYFDYFEAKKFLETFNIPSVPTEYVGIFQWNTLEELLKAAEGNYPKGHPKEGIVIRLLDYNNIDCHALGYHGSFKVINNMFLEKTKE